jgi:hypothetical protein
MSLLKQVTKGPIKTPSLVLIYGPDGMGKSTFGSEAPSPIFLGTEKGTANLDVARYPAVRAFADILAAIDDLTANGPAFGYQTVIIDSLDWLEPLVWDHVCKEHNWKTIEDPGYGKGYVVAIKAWQGMIDRLRVLQEKTGMGVIAIAHSQIKKFQDPINATEYDRYQLKMNDKAAALWREYVDFVLFVNSEVFTKKDEAKKVRAFGGDTIKLYTRRSAAFDAKSRLPLEAELDFPKGAAWKTFESACMEARTPSPERLIENINQLMTLVKDEALKTKVKEALAGAGSDAGKLGVIHNRLLAVTAA